MTQNVLANCNPTLVNIDGVYQSPCIATSGHGLSTYLTLTVPTLISECIEDNRDLGLFSYSLETQLDTPELKQAFAAAPHNILRACDFDALSSRNAALDLSQGFGGCALFLSSYFSNVDSINLSLPGAQLSRQRALGQRMSVQISSAQQQTEQGSINHFAMPLDKLHLPSKHYDFIYVGSVEELKLNADQSTALLGQLHQALTDAGALVVSVKNRNRLSKWLNTERAPTDSVVPYHDLYKNEHAHYYNLQDFDLALAQSGFSYSHLHASFSARDDVPNLFSLRYLRENTNAINHCYRLGSIANDALSEYALYQALSDSDEDLAKYASRYLALVGKKDLRDLYNNDFTYFAGNSRMPQWRTITAKGAGQSQVTKQAIFPEVEKQAQENATRQLSQNLEPQPFHQGSLLIDQWLQALIQRDDKAFSTLLDAYLNWLNELEHSGDFKRYAYDLLPFNVVCNEHNGGYQFIDAEWQTSAEISPSFVLFRALFWLAFENRSIMSGFCEHWGFKTVGAFVQHYLLAVGGETLGDEDIASFIKSSIELEEGLQAQISHHFSAQSIQHAMQHPFVGNPVNAPIGMSIKRIGTQVTWSDAQDHFDQAHATYIQWSTMGNQSATVITQHLDASFSQTDSAKKWLRLDPIDCPGVFQVQSLALHSQAGDVIWALDSAADISAAATLRNAERIAYEGHAYVALNDDPFLLFDLSELTDLASIGRVEVSLELHRDAHCEAALATLRNLVNQHTQAIVALGNKGHETRADIDVLTAKLEHTEHTKQHLQSQVAEIEALREQNQQLHKALLSTPNARLKRLINRVLISVGLRKP